MAFLHCTAKPRSRTMDVLDVWRLCIGTSEKVIHREPLTSHMHKMWLSDMLMVLLISTAQIGPRAPGDIKGWLPNEPVSGETKCTEL